MNNNTWVVIGDGIAVNTIGRITEDLSNSYGAKYRIHFITPVRDFNAYGDVESIYSMVISSYNIKRFCNTLKEAILELIELDYLE